MELTSSLKNLVRDQFRPGTAYRVWFGPLRGYRIVFDRALSVREVLGLSEQATFALLDRVVTKGGLLRDGAVFVDAGANIGLYSLWFSKKLRKCADAGIVAFEPAVETASLLRQNLRLNTTANVRVVQAALSDTVGKAEFAISANHHTSGLDLGQVAAAHYSVETTSLDAFFSNEKLSFLKIDIEGGARKALPGARRCLETQRPVLYIESHNPGEDQAIADVLKDHHYAAFRTQDTCWVHEPTKTHPHPQGVWGKLILVPFEKRQIFETIL